ncbi:methyltransferase domain protein [Halobacteriovorax sp. BALOs_7]|uniref:class I SAM-dependent methyltransferase n=1 Tax=Halobacteriovorax sp. BALOs_7 TaxID=2109558 RepID=UPI000EA00EB7|nr:class I SAM-dependent methyltransferase [Halobacteriovorax sp. BALOs_7]AYF45509.1 methyltransferase domain protein [Halobacteriovorax sp. BALOs_7]
MFQFIRNLLNQKGFNAKAKRAFTNYYRFARESKSYLSYCNKMHGIECFMQNNLSKKQFEALTTHFKPNMKVLDIGCGTGDLTDYFAKNYKLKAKGMDLVESKFKYKEANFETTWLGENEYDLVISLDGFYMLNDLYRTLNKVMDSLKPKGKFVLTYTSERPFDKSRLGKALKKRKHDVKDFTQDDKVFNNKAKDLLQEMKSSFIEEGNSSLFHTKYNEIKKNVDSHQNGKMYRSLVTIYK